MDVQEVAHPPAVGRAGRLGEPDEQVLAVGVRAGQRGTVEGGGLGREARLQAGRPHGAAAEGPLQLTREPMQGVALGHAVLLPLATQPTRPARMNVARADERGGFGTGGTKIATFVRATRS